MLIRRLLLSRPTSSLLPRGNVRFLFSDSHKDKDPQPDFDYHVDSQPTVHIPRWSDHYLRPSLEKKTDDARRGFSYVVTAAGFAGTGVLVKNFALDILTFMAPTPGSLIVGETEITMDEVPSGQAATVKWKKKPIFVRHRTDEEIEKARADDNAALRDPETDAKRTRAPEWLVVIGVCTHLGCVPVNGAGDYRGWFCPCHGSHYDLSGRIRKGPAPRNLEVPPYVIDQSSGKIIIGREADDDDDATTPPTN